MGWWAFPPSHSSSISGFPCHVGTAGTRKTSHKNTQGLVLRIGRRTAKQSLFSLHFSGKQADLFRVPLYNRMKEAESIVCRSRGPKFFGVAKETPKCFPKHLEGSWRNHQRSNLNLSFIIKPNLPLIRLKIAASFAIMVETLNRVLMRKKYHDTIDRACRTAPPTQITWLKFCCSSRENRVKPSRLVFVVSHNSSNSLNNTGDSQRAKDRRESYLLVISVCFHVNLCLRRPPRD
jgi:hypothetical protein